MPEFKTRLKKFRIKRIIKSRDFIISLLVLIILEVLFFFGYGIESNIMQNILSDISGASITLATIILAGFAIIISFIDVNFIKFLKEAKVGESCVYDNVMFLFEWNTYTAFFVFGLSLINKYIIINQFFFGFVLSSFIYLIISIMALVSFITKFGMQRSDFIDATND